MTAITIPASMKPLFGQVSEPVSVRDEQGNVLGFFTPMRQATQEDYEWARQQFTEQEIEAARSEPGGFTTQEVLDHLSRLSR
ncbi:MAG TPA: hypothetical protein VFB96_24190 [Pirellulaceae bacterium]|jgi:hypothetical protein|nr:hypothetical protein [Pirellulaceae bacterium]